MRIIDVDGNIFETKVFDDGFQIRMTQESDYSTDGGYSFNMETFCDLLDVAQAKELTKELIAFCESAEQNFHADDATAKHYGQTSSDDYVYSTEITGAKPHRP